MIPEYLLILSSFLLIAILLDWKYHVKIYDSWKERIAIPLFYFIFGVAWDSFAVYRGHWSFEGAGLIGIKIGILPLEEYLFFLILPYFAITTYKALRKKV